MQLFDYLVVWKIYGQVWEDWGLRGGRLKRARRNFLSDEKWNPCARRSKEKANRDPPQFEFDLCIIIFLRRRFARCIYNCAICKTQQSRRTTERKIAEFPSDFQPSNSRRKWADTGSLLTHSWFFFTTPALHLTFRYRMLSNNAYNIGRRAVCLKNLKFYKHIFYLSAHNVIVFYCMFFAYKS